MALVMDPGSESRSRTRSRTRTTRSGDCHVALVMGFIIGRGTGKRGGGGETEREGEGEGKEEAGRGEVGGGEEREGEGVGERPGAGPQGAAEWGSIRDDCPHCSRAAPLRLWGSMTTQCTHLVNCPRCQLPRRALGALRRVRLADASLLRRPSRSAVAFSESREEPKPRDG